MGFFDFFTSSTTTDKESFLPGGRTDGIRLTYAPSTRIIEYQGRYGMRGSFAGQDITATEVKPISRTHGVLLIHGSEGILFTTDVLRLAVCESAKEWIDARTLPATAVSTEGDELSPATQSATAPTTTPAEADPFAALKKLKELYDLQIITAEEYETKKNELLKKI